MVFVKKVCFSCSLAISASESESSLAALARFVAVSRRALVLRSSSLRRRAWMSRASPGDSFVATISWMVF